MTQRRARLKAAKRQAAERVKAKILPVFRSQYRRLERFLRRANLRKRLNKIKVPAGLEPPSLDIQNLMDITFPAVPGAIGYKITVEDPEKIALEKMAALYKVDQLFKAPSPPKSDTSEWDNFKKALLIALLLGLFAGVDDIGDVENEIWASRGYDPLTFDPQQVVEDYQLRTGRNLSDLGADTLISVQNIITQWYLKDDPFEPFKNLLDDLDKQFNAARAKAIASTEVGNLTSQIFLQEMSSNGWSEWYWDALGENPCTKPIQILNQVYDGCLDLNGRKFKIGTPMPPDAAHPNCECLPMPAFE
jgi:hypothetical protein